MRISRDCWQCEYTDCGHVWIASGFDSPEQCSKCKRRKWHTPDAGLIELAASARKNGAPRRRRILKTDAIATADAKVTIAQEVEVDRKAVAMAAADVRPAAEIPAPKLDSLLRTAHHPRCTCGICTAEKGS